MADDDGVQYADSFRRGGLGDYPAEWGMPPGARFSEERAAWVRTHARRWQLDPLRGSGSSRFGCSMTCA